MAAEQGTSPSSDDRPTGTARWVGQYQVFGEIGRGAGGAVYRALDNMGREVAIKELRLSQLAPDEIPEARQRFVREAQAVARLEHDNIVFLYNFIEGPDSLYQVMEFVPGGSLDKLIKGETRLTSREILGIVRQVAGALDHAHENGIIHRDIKPGNILVNGLLAKVTDFGIARIISQTITRTDTTMGTPAWMAPEQIKGSKVDAKADQFSLGVVAYQLLGRRLPFVGSSHQAVMFQIVNLEPPSLLEANPDLPPAVERVVRRALAKNPDDRFASCGAFANALEQALLPPVTTVRGTVPVRSGINKRLTAAVGALLVVAAALYFGWPGLARRHIARPHDGETAPLMPVEKMVPSSGKASPPRDPKLASSAPATVPINARQTAPPTRALPQPDTPKVGDRPQNPRDGLIYVWIPPGNFVMGCSPGDIDICVDDEKLVRVMIASGFFMGQTEVTQAAYRRITGQNPSHFKGDDLPVESVSWDLAKNYCEAVRGRLPTEKEWEYAARAGATGPRYGVLDAIAWHGYNSGGTTHPVGLKQANAFGLYDMLGNVAEWTDDNYSPGRKAVRGAAWDFGTEFFRVAAREKAGPATRVPDIGFRCVAEISAFASAAPAPPIGARQTAPPAAALTQPSPPKVGDKWQNPKDGEIYAWVPPGSFMMGCSPGDDECDDNEASPPRPERIAVGFWLGANEVTQVDYQRLTDKKPSSFRGNRLLRSDSYPVESVSWRDADHYCKATGGRLPTEKEWEYAARAGTTGPYYDALNSIAWYYDNSNHNPHSVRFLRPNAYGLYDMLGNVSEWTWANSYFGTKVARGGSWGRNAKNVRVSVRLEFEPEEGSSYIGFRCAVDFR